MKGLYIHIPFCQQKCRYCSFVSYPRQLDKAEEYAAAVVRELKQYPKYEVGTIYFGGGTPTAVCPAVIGRILDAAYDHFAVYPGAEITIEANPATVTAESLASYRKMGINRISIGAQSFVGDELLFLGRLHTPADTEAAVQLARQAGFSNLSLDLIFGLPGQTVAAVEYSLERMAALKPEHISCYALSIEKGTPLYEAAEQGKFVPLDGDAVAELYETVCAYLRAAGYEQYEISNFSLPGYESRHNCNYWRCGEYIGAGAGASGYLEGVRYHNPADLDAYFTGVPREIEEVLDQSARQSEMMILGLRLVKEGVSVSRFREQFGKDVFSVFGKQLKKHERFIRQNGDVLILEPAGYYVSNAIFTDFL